MKNLTCVGPNTTKAEIVLSWAKPNGQHTGLRITVDNNSSIDVLNSTSNQTLPSLRHNTEYGLKVVTLSCGKPSIPLYKKCRTGITGRTSIMSYIKFKMFYNTTQCSVLLCCIYLTIYLFIFVFFFLRATHSPCNYDNAGGE